MKRILIYGGCHAQIIQNFLQEILPRDQFQLSLLVNFKLIESGKPFPYAELSWYDWLIYSPIENHGSYNTDSLKEACARAGCASICYPWLEWHGYCPGAHKAAFKGRHQWYYPQLFTVAEEFSSFDLFYRHVVENFPDEQTISQVFEMSTAMVRAAEARHAMEVRISDFIIENFRSSRLFLISDHPSLKVYQELIRQILVAMGLPQEIPPGSREPQAEARIPIFPSVARQLGLTFADTHWIDDELLPGAIWNLRTYLRLYYHPDGVILEPLENARLFDSVITPGAQASRPACGSPAAPDTRLHARPTMENIGETLVDYELLEVLNKPTPANPAFERFALNPSEWRSSWMR